MKVAHSFSYPNHPAGISLQQFCSKRCTHLITNHIPNSLQLHTTNLQLPSKLQNSPSHSSFVTNSLQTLVPARALPAKFSRHSPHPPHPCTPPSRHSGTASCTHVRPPCHYPATNHGTPRSLSPASEGLPLAVAPPDDTQPLETGVSSGSDHERKVPP
ncbi:hypothetical protein N431DRAFT_56181 [Stipitochalara longipes BDJ]|nr:hypothetical protein N431DRAFT_56181 [Stipitochalara longipes BDJ]